MNRRYVIAYVLASLLLLLVGVFAWDLAAGLWFAMTVLGLGWYVIGVFEEGN